ncbi:hypothetical protein [Sinorhizobium chiapasense]|uniref:Transposase n=1 Tax=Sinorhizobium chiapasense TaxID=501572 RepID=A0ABZ2BKF9_9HYPH
MAEPMLQDMREDANLLLTAPTTPIPSKTLGQRKTAWADIPSKRTASSGPPQQNVIERFFNKLKQFHSIATRYDKEPATFSRP